MLCVCIMLSHKNILHPPPLRPTLIFFSVLLVGAELVFEDLAVVVVCIVGLALPLETVGQEAEDLCVGDEERRVVNGEPAQLVELVLRVAVLDIHHEINLARRQQLVGLLEGGHGKRDAQFVSN